MSRSLYSYINISLINTLSFISALLSRLNDPHKDVRESAIKAMSVMELQKDSNEDDVQMWSQLMNDVFKTISLHLHDSDEKTRMLLLGMMI